VFLFTAVQPSFLPTMAAHAAEERKSDFIRLTRRVLAICLTLTVVAQSRLWHWDRR
jgi:peptidoglycan biosynthesis protein MviN/MurJ (putative lipid II flippase)